MQSMINKGFVSALVEDGKKAVVIPQEASGTVTFPLTISVFLLECLEIGMPVVYATFPDNTGIVLARLDGEWNHKIYRQLTVEGWSHMTDRVTVDSGITGTGSSGAGEFEIVGNIKLNGSINMDGNINMNGNIDTNGNISASNNITASSVSANGVRLESHVHGGVESGGSETTPPK